MSKRTDLEALIVYKTKETRDHVDAAITNIEYLLSQMRTASHELDRRFQGSTDSSPSATALLVIVQHSKTDMRIPQLTEAVLNLGHLERTKDKEPQETAQ